MKKDKKRTMNELRQTKDSVYKVPNIGSEGEVEQDPIEEIVTGQNNPWDVHGNNEYRKSYEFDLLYQLKELRKKYPNNQEFGAEVAKLL